MKRNVDNLFVHFDEAKGKSRKEIFEQYDNTLKDVARLPFDMNFPEGLKVKNPVVKCAEAFFLDHAHNHKHEKEYTIEDYKRGFTLISPKNEMRIVSPREFFVSIRCQKPRVRMRLRAHRTEAGRVLYLQDDVRTKKKTIPGQANGTVFYLVSDE